MYTLARNSSSCGLAINAPPPHGSAGLIFRDHDLDAGPRWPIVAGECSQVAEAVFTMDIAYACRRATDRVGVRIRLLQLLVDRPSVMAHACRVEECDLNGWFEVDVEQLEEIQLVDRALGIYANDFASETIDRPCSKSHSSETSRPLGEALDVLGARFLAGLDCVGNQCNAAVDR